MAKLWFENHEGIMREIAEVKDFKEVFDEINKFIEQCNVGRPKDQQFTSYYTRVYEQNGLMKMDVGSWSEFFYTDLTEEDFKRDCKSSSESENAE